MGVTAAALLLTLFSALSCGHTTQQVCLQTSYSEDGQCNFSFVLPPLSCPSERSGEEKVTQELDQIKQGLLEQVEELKLQNQGLSTKVEELAEELSKLKRTGGGQTQVDPCAEGHRLPGVLSCYQLWKLGCRESGRYVIDRDGPGFGEKPVETECTFDSQGDLAVLPRTCTDVLQKGETRSGTYTIDPDGPYQSVPPFQVYCNMTAENGAGVTTIGHDSEARTHVQGFEQAGSYRRTVTYDHATIDQIRALIDASESCKQFIKYECKGSIMYGPDFKNDNRIVYYAWWQTWDCREAYYWGGASPGSQDCDCMVTGTCDNPDHPCNCNINDDVWRQDSGFLTHKDDLPVKQLRFGDTTEPENGYHTLGKLMCFG
ncbi:PREDICTED: contactin-associated protein-like 2 [Branchiostoma belcheri]|uniref:Contactin-associated protein-like 2 n=1 Tax=Branchiostoma belcheri TaxID=7741 RepID=A0A6P5A5P9_BRABE|nr:PREDICTED: contactin-associated protein-like 2 [Branchiostoma belcheri]